jgi:hypothetical protein
VSYPLIIICMCLSGIKVVMMLNQILSEILSGTIQK